MAPKETKENVARRRRVSLGKSGTDASKSTGKTNKKTNTKGKRSVGEALTISGNTKKTTGMKTRSNKKTSSNPNREKKSSLKTSPKKKTSASKKVARGKAKRSQTVLKETATNNKKKDEPSSQTSASLSRKKPRSRRTITRKSPPETPFRARDELGEELVVVSQGKGDKYKLFDDVLKKSGFWFVLEEKRIRSAVDSAHFTIIIKPDMDALELMGSTATDPQLVEHLIDALHERGYTDVVVAESRNSFDLWLENRDVQILADMLGYRYLTPAGREYDIIDLADDLVPGPFAEENLLHGTHLSRKWLESDFRILFAKNKTDDDHAYHLCLDNLVSILPLRDKDYHYRHRLDRKDVLLELLKNTTVDFCIIDGLISNHGNAGSRVARPIETATLIAGRSLLLTDHTAALKMGIDPNVSEIHAQAADEMGLPEPYHIEGDMTPYREWINVDPLMLKSVRARQQWPELSQVLQPWLQKVDQESFPFKDPINEQLNHLVGSYLAGVDENPTVFWNLIGLNHFIGFIYQGLEAWQIMYWKDRLWHKEVSLNFSLDAYSLEDYEAIVPYLEPLEQDTLALRADANGLRWTFHDDGSVLFEFSRILPVDYDDFVERVDITKSIQYMNDYIGGLIVPVQHDDQGRVTCQAERNLYLPQPNYLVFYQGQDIDVSKLELIRYGTDEQKMFWKTIKSENGSATYDDGIVRFVRQKNGNIGVHIFGRQQFTLPLFWQIVNLDNYPALKDVLFTHAYTTFFTNTMANFEAVYEGREVRIGKPWDQRAGEPGMEGQVQAPSDQVVAFLTRAQDYIQSNMPDKKGFVSKLFANDHPKPDHIDEDGFAHFKPMSKDNTQQGKEDASVSESRVLFASAKGVAEGFWKSLFEAIQKDIGLGYK